MVHRHQGDPWLEHWLPLDLDDLPVEFAKKRFDFRDLVFDKKCLHVRNVRLA